MICLRRIIVVISILVFLLGINAISAKEIIVDLDGAGDFISINDAINAANGGDSILIKNGEYSVDTITISKPLTIEGESMAGVILSSEHPSGLFNIKAETQLKKMTLISTVSNAIEVASNDVFMEYITHSPEGYSTISTDPNQVINNLIINHCMFYKGLEIQGAKNMLIKNTDFIGSWGLELKAITSDIESCEFSGGKVIMDSSCNDVVFKKCVFEDYDHSCFSMNGNSNKVYNCLFQNITGLLSSALILQGENNEIKGCTFQYNDEGIYVVNGTDSEIKYNNFLENIICGVNGESGYINDNGYWVGMNVDDNWWGHATGPYHESLNPGGEGDNISGYVELNSWMNSISTWTEGSGSGQINNNDDNTEVVTPGFGLLLLILTFCIALLVLSQKR